MKDFVLKIDKWFAKMLHELYLLTGDFGNGLMKGISYIAEAGILFLVVGIGLALFKRTRKAGGVVLLSVAIGFIFTNLIFKNAIGRLRPFEANSQYWLWWLDAGSVVESGYSFPSGHTTAATAFALAIFLTTKKKYSWPILAFPLLMASSRMYLMVHYFSDCVGGVLVGSASAVIAYLIVKWIYKSRLKICVWARELDLFRKKVTAPKEKSAKVEKIEDDKTEYVSQSEEKPKTLIQRDITLKTTGTQEDEE